MNGLTRFLDWLDEAAAGFIRLAYLLAGITAVALYFGAGHLPALIEGPLNGALPWILAFAVETHTYITARRVRAAWQDKQWTALKVNLAILAGLLAFSAWNQLNYLVETWIPPVGALPLPSWASYLVRALVVPCAFMAAAFLAPMAEPVTAQIEAEARATLHDVFRIARKQRRQMLKHAERDGRDMTGALVELVPDPETRRIISHAYNAIGAPVQTDAPLIAEATLAPSSEAMGVSELSDTPEAAANEPPSRPPTGPGSPTRKRGVRTPVASDAPNVVPMPATASRSRRSSRRPRKVAKGRVRTAAATATVEAQARAAWRPGMSVTQLQHAANISRSAAGKYRRTFVAESTARHAQIEQQEPFSGGGSDEEKEAAL